VHHELVGLTLAKHGILGTFYTDLRGDLLTNPGAWRGLGAAGNELGNHSLFHPGRMDGPLDWLEPCFNLAGYLTARLRSELLLANRVLTLIADFCAKCQDHNLYIRDASTISPELGASAVRISVKDESTNRRMVEIVGKVPN